MSVTTTSSPVPISSDDRTVFTPVVAFATKAIPSGSAFRNSESLVIASAQSPPVAIDAVDRVRFHDGAQVGLVVKHCPGGGAERPVIQEDDVRIQLP